MVGVLPDRPFRRGMVDNIQSRVDDRFVIARSGVSLLEKSLKKTKPGYQEYIETTSEFIPWFPRRKRMR